MDQDALRSPLPEQSDLQSITFLPVNQSEAAQGQRTRRGYQSCDNCRTKKKRCEPSERAEICRRCQEEPRACLTTHRRKKRKLRVPVNSAPAHSGQAVNLPRTAVSTSTECSPVQEVINPVPQYGVRSPSGVLDGAIQRLPNTKERILATDLLDARDALDLIAVAGSKETIDQEYIGPGEQQQHVNTVQQSVHIHSRPIRAPSTDWDQYFLVRRGIIRPCDVTEYLDFYFSQLWPLFPVIPQFYASRDQYHSLAVKEPVLATSLIALASRYHSLSGNNGLGRSERIHWRTWPWVSRFFSTALWGSSGMRSFGAIAALLLSIEWHPRAINSSEDFIGDCGELGMFEPPSHLEDTRMAPSSVPARLNLVATAYRSNKMCWMLLSTAISLAQEIGCFDEEQPTSTALRNQSDSTTLNLEWTRSLRTFLRLTDASLALRLRLEPQLAGGRGLEMVDYIPPTLAADALWESAIELATYMHKARELLRGWRKSDRGSGPLVPVAAWESFRRGLDHWKSRREFLNGNMTLPYACLDLEYYYIRLCGLSPAAHMFENASGHFQEMSYASSLSQFSDEATRASIDTLNCVLQSIVPTALFKFVAVKIWLYIVCAALYLLKVTLKAEDHFDYANPRIQLISRVVASIKENAPDDIHMAQRYAILLEALLNAALKSNSAGQTAQPSASNSPLPTHTNYMYSDYFIDPPGDWMYDSHFWNSLPGMVGLDSVPNLFTGIPAVE
ncbi:hypothetical protein BJX99DRAFT_269823 [Aspergillus californicus]